MDVAAGAALGLAAGADFDSVFDSALPAPSEGLAVVESEALSGAFSEVFFEDE